MGWYIALGILVLLALLPLGVSVKYDAGGLLVKVIAGPVRIKVFPRPKKTGKKEKPQKKEPARTEPVKTRPQSSTAEKALEAPKPQPKQEKGGKLTDFLPLVKVALNFLGDFRRKLRVNRLELKLILAGDDPCDLAVNYGRAWAAVGNLMPQLERFFKIKKRNVEVECDFTENESKVIARLDLTITLGRLVALAAVYAVRAIREFLKIKNKRKGGAVNESKSS